MTIKRLTKFFIWPVALLILSIGMLAIFLPIEEEAPHSQYRQVKFIAVLEKPMQADIDEGEVQWIWRASHGVLDQFVDNYDGSLVSKEQWLSMTETEREELLLNGQ